MPSHQLATPELATVEIQGMSRGAFVLRSVFAAGAVYGAAVVGPFVRQSFAQEAEGESTDIDILNFALTLELLEANFYETASRDVPGLGGDIRDLTEQLASDEAEHVAALTSLIRDLKGTPVEAPAFEYGDAFANQANYLTLAQTFEDTGVAAYNGAAPQILDKKLLAVAGTIVQIEGRHAALIRRARGADIAPVAFDETLEKGEVLRAVDPFILS